MKRWSSVVLMSVLTLAFTSAGLRADEGKEDHHRKDDRGRAEWQAKVFDRLKDRLGLTDEQAGKLKDAFEAHKKDVKPLRRDMKVNLEKLRWQVDAKADAKDISATLDQIKSSRAAMREAHEKFATELAGILTPEQRARMALWRVDMMKRRRGMMMHRMGPEDGHGFGRWEGHGPDRRGPPPPGPDRDGSGPQE